MAELAAEGRGEPGDDTMIGREIRSIGVMTGAGWPNTLVTW
jgi:hypothetical protein